MSGFLNNPMLMAGASGNGAQDGPSFDASLAEALQEGAEKVGDTLKR